MSTFDVQAFENQIIEEANETKTTPVPEGVYTGLVDSQRIKTISPSKGPNEGKELPVLEVTWVIDDEDGKLAEELNRDKVTVRQDIWLDVSDSGGLAFGPNQNVGLGRLREALGLNKPGKAFSFGMLEGQGPAQVHVGQREQADTGDIFNTVPKITPVE